MRIPNSILKTSLVLFALLVLTSGVKTVRAQTVYLICTFDTSSVWKKDGRDKFERRLYVSNMVSMTKEAYLAADSSGGRLEGLCGDYFDNTVNKAATARGERLDPSGQLKIFRNIELSGEDAGGPNPYNFASKEQVEKKRDELIKELKDAGRIIYTFNWDVTGADEASDLENENKRTQPTIGPNSKAGTPTSGKTTP